MLTDTDEDLQDLLEPIPKKMSLSSQGTGKQKQEVKTYLNNRQVCLGVQNEAGQRLTVFPRESTGYSRHPLLTTQEMTTHGYHWRVNSEITLIIFFAAEDGEALYSQQKQD